MTDYSEKKKAWTKKWALMRKDFLKGKLLDVVIQQAPGVSEFWWECPLCGSMGTAVTRKSMALTAGRGHMQTHVSGEDYEALEDLKVTTMPEELLTWFQSNRRDQVLNARRTTDGSATA